jgi:hypothetical protein
MVGNAEADDQRISARKRVGKFVARSVGKKRESLACANHADTVFKFGDSE